MQCTGFYKWTVITPIFRNYTNAAAPLFFIMFITHKVYKSDFLAFLLLCVLRLSCEPPVKRIKFRGLWCRSLRGQPTCLWLNWKKNTDFLLNKQWWTNPPQQALSVSSPPCHSRRANQTISERVSNDFSLFVHPLLYFASALSLFLLTSQCVLIYISAVVL